MFRQRLAQSKEIYEAAERGNVSSMERLLTANPKLANEMNYGSSFYRLLDIAAMNGNKEMVMLLLAHHADINHKNENGETALDLAQERGKIEIAALLREHGGSSGIYTWRRFFSISKLENAFLPWLIFSVLFLVASKVVEKACPNFWTHFFCFIAWTQLLSWSIAMLGNIALVFPFPFPATLVLLQWLGNPSPYAEFPVLSVVSYVFVGLIVACIKLSPHAAKSGKS